MITLELTFREFENKILQQEHEKSDFESIHYRGQSAQALTTTLQRQLEFSKENISVNNYYDVVRDTILNSSIPELHMGDLPSTNIFHIGLMYANEEHKKAIEKAFAAIVKLRHLGFPSPFLDCTFDPYIAARFAFLKPSNEPKSIFCFKKFNPPTIKKIDLFIPELYLLPHEAIMGSHERHIKQKSAYLFFIYNDRKAYYKNVKVPFFQLSEIKNGAGSNFTIERYIITDSDKNYNNIDEKLRERGLTSDSIYGNFYDECSNRKIEEEILEFMKNIKLRCS